MKAVLINPAVNPNLLFEGLMGQEMENSYTGEQHTFVQDDLVVLKEIAGLEHSYPKKIMCLLETEDEVLDYRLAEKKYKLCRLKIIEGGDHRFQHFEECLAEILEFLRPS